jgi:phosphoribosyl 1,2-cyclic phosphodiesterase
VSLDIAGADPILFDLGTGLRYFGHSLSPEQTFSGTCLLSHMHWDHIQGLPFFTPLMKDESNVVMYGPIQDGERSIEQIFADTIQPPLFPIHLSMLPGTIQFEEGWEAAFSLGDVEVLARPIPHNGNTVGYRVSAHGRSVAYLSDHQMPFDGSFSATDGALDLCRGADLVIHDAQYTPSEFAEKRDWGHCTIDYAIWLAAEAGAKKLALFHHAPTRHDDMMDQLAADAVVCGRELGIEVFAASEGLSVELGVS